MNVILRKLNGNLLICSLALLVFIAGCARDLSSKVYTSDASFNLVLEGKVIKSRPIVIKNTDQISHNGTGILAGGAMGGVVGSSASGGSGGAIAAGILAGAVIGSLVESSMGTADGIEYIVKIDRTKLSNDYYEGSALLREAIASARASGTVAIVQSKDQPLQAGQDVYVILSPKRARVTAK